MKLKAKMRSSSKSSKQHSTESRQLRANIGKAVKKLIEAKGIDSEQAANEIGISLSIFSDVIRERNHISQATFSRLRIWIDRQMNKEKPPEIS